MKKSTEIMCHIIDWLLAIIGIVLSFKNGSFLKAVVILIVAVLVSLIFIFAHCIFKLKKKIETKDKEKSILEEQKVFYKSHLETYEKLLSNSYPLYGIVNYLAKNRDGKYKNTSCKLQKLFLEVRLVNEIVQNKHNDLQIIWEFSGINISSEKLDRLYQRIGGDSGTSFDKIDISVVECFSKDQDCSKYSENCGDIIPKKCPTSRKMNVEDIKEYSTATYHLLKYDFANPIYANDSYRVRVKYTWPQCFNPNFDFLLVDPENFAESIVELSIVVHLDNIVITENTSVFLFSFEKQSNSHQNEGKFEYINDKYFEIKKKNICQDRMYYVKIINNKT